MMFMTARVDLKKILTIVGIIAAVILAVIWLFGGTGDAAETAAPSVSTNDGRVNFLKGFGWDIAASPVESSQVRIPEESSEAFGRYNNLQKSQGYDLTEYAGKTVMRYVYKINNYPATAEPVYATLLVYKNQIIGGDVTNTAAKGAISGFQMPQTENPATSVPTEETTVPSTTVPETTQ